MSHTSKRIHRISYILSMLEAAKEKDKVWSEERLVSEVCIKFGAGRRYIKELLTDLEYTKRIVKDIGEVFLPEQYEKLRDQAKQYQSIDKEANDILDNITINNKNQKGVKQSGN